MLLLYRKLFSLLGRSDGMATSKIAAISNPTNMERSNLISMALFKNQ
ncbi:hypothetical protein XCR1_1060034 [Xenorhabdus cabanillasii JM26]|uniref:Uncharacterized protein n=1 Tax=Xenorhabdus cabanillasii JM26 TaxID=1427517 RepID=W1IMX4_9GAMM|nr:hypothetical protein XCR1_1060034 [Xenorhabdus cabanillasii JM26]